MEELRKKLAELDDYIDSARYDIDSAIDEINNLYVLIEEKDSKTIKDIDNLKRELKRDGLYSDKLEEFLENYMKYYNK